MLVCVFYVQFAHETAGAARTRSSLRPLLAPRVKSYASLGHLMPRECGPIPSRCLESQSGRFAIHVCHWRGTYRRMEVGGSPIRCHLWRVQSLERPGAGVVIRSLQADAERRGSPGRLSEPNIVTSWTAGPAQS
jgi:hypothetical protein